MVILLVLLSLAITEVNGLEHTLENTLVSFFKLLAGVIVGALSGILALYIFVNTILILCNGWLYLIGKDEDIAWF